VTPTGGEPLRLGDDLTAEWPVWRLWSRGLLPLTAVDTVTLREVTRANDVLDALDEAEARAARRNR
jgi:hypothetical protein